MLRQIRFQCVSLTYAVARVYRISRPVRPTVIFSLQVLEKNNDECILILVICWKKTGLLHILLQESIHSQGVMPDLMIWKQISLSHDKDVV
jgi:hypothetical protein